MYDNALFVLVKRLMVANLPAYNLPAATVQRNFQPTQQGRKSGQVIYFTKIFDNLYGSPDKSTRLDKINNKRIRKNLQVIQSTWQLAATVDVDPESITQLLAPDILKITAAMVSSDPFQQALVAQGVDILRMQTVNAPSVLNDREQYENNPVVVLVLVHNDKYEFDVQKLEALEAAIRRV